MGCGGGGSQNKSALAVRLLLSSRKMQGEKNWDLFVLRARRIRERLYANWPKRRMNVKGG